MNHLTVAEIDRLRLILQDVAQLDDGIVQILETSEATWAVRFEDVDVEIELDSETGRLMLLTELAVPPEARRAEIYEFILIYAMLRRETGVHMALSEVGGPIVQTVDLNLESLAPTLFAAVLHDLERRTLAWRDFIDGENALPVAP